MSDFSLPHFVPPFTDKIRDRAPGLKLSTIDQLLRDAWVEGYWTGMGETRPEVDAVQFELAQVRRTVSEVINRRLGHTSRKLREDRRRRTTIAAEREWQIAAAEEIDAAIVALGSDRS